MLFYRKSLKNSRSSSNGAQLPTCDLQEKEVRQSAPQMAKGSATTN